MKNWQFNILFFVGVGGAVIMLFGSAVGLNIESNPTAVAGIGAILTYVLTQKAVFTKKDTEKKDARKENNGPDE